MDTLFRITHSSNFNTSIQALMLIEQLATSKHVAVDRFYRTLYESLLDPRLITSSKHALYLNLLYRALRSDLNVKRVKAFAKRLLQVVTLHQPPFICGVLYLLRELETTFPGLKSLLRDAEENDADEEVFYDVPETRVDPTPQELHNGIHNDRAMSYDGRKRDPEHSNADKSCLWELVSIFRCGLFLSPTNDHIKVPFLAHFHPSVSLFATRLVSDEKMPPKPDMASHALSNFLDRFVYRNAKAAAGGTRGSSIMQPLSGGESRGILLSSKATSYTQNPVNTEAFWHKKAEDVAVDEVFFHKYFNQIGKAKHALGNKNARSKVTGGSDDEDDENEDEIWQALVDSRPEVESDDDSDLEMLDLDDSEAESSVSSFEVDGDNEGALEPDGPENGGSDAYEDGALFDEGGSGSEIDQLFANELHTGHAEEPEEQGEETSRQRRKKLKSLPTFASTEDYAEMLENDEDEDM
jgi:ribosome biogenesis protein MAK21